MTVAMTTPPSVTAWQSELVGQEIPVTPPIACGVVCAAHCTPRSVVAMTWPADDPAQQSVADGQYTLVRSLIPDGTVCAVQEVPALVVARIAPPWVGVCPTAKQSLAVGHETALMLMMDEVGNARGFHAPPPSAVAHATAAARCVEEFRLDPATRQWVVLPHETLVSEFRLAGKLFC